jgi:hypothetical protein
VGGAVVEQRARLVEVVAPDVGQRNPHPRLGARTRDAEADAARAARDERDPAGELLHASRTLVLRQRHRRRVAVDGRGQRRDEDVERERHAQDRLRADRVLRVVRAGVEHDEVAALLVDVEAVVHAVALELLRLVVGGEPGDRVEVEQLHRRERESSGPYTQMPS